MTDHAMDHPPRRTRVALVTGATRGLGLETARQLAGAGVTTILGARDLAAGEREARRLRDEGHDAFAVPLDVRSPAAVRAAARQVEAEAGRLDILVNNAGVLPEATAAPGSGPVDVQQFLTTYDTNVFGPVRVVQELLPLLRASGSGRIVNVSSTMGSLADQGDPSSPYYGVVVPAYQSSKAALNSVTISLAKLLEGSDVKVTSVCPGFVQTDLTPMSRAQAPLTAADAARTVVEVALAGDDAPTGGFVDRDGVVAW